MIMKNFFLLVAFACCLTIVRCNTDDDVVSYDYHAHIKQPSGAAKQMGDVLFIDVEFESHTGANVEHINIRIRDADNMTVVYNMPADPHVPVNGSDYEFQDQFILSTENGISPGDWVLEARVWGKDEGQDQEVETVTFRINP